MPLVCLLLTILAGAAQSAAVPPAATLGNIRTRLDAYEKQEQQLGRPDPAALAAIARLAFERALRSATFAEWSEACASTAVNESVDCRTKLSSVLNDAKAPIARRAAAGAALIRRGDPDAPARLFDAVTPLDTAQLAPIASIIGLLPEARAVPLLFRLLESPSPSGQIAACRVLGKFDAPDVRTALAKAVKAAPPGADVWATCMTARARLKEQDAVYALWGYGRELEGDDLLDVATAMLEVGDDRGIEFLQTLARRGTGAARLAAAERLVDSDPEAATRVADLMVQAPDPKLRAGALVVERRLKRPPSAAIRGLLADPNAVVGLRAAEVVLDWVARQPGR